MKDHLVALCVGHSRQLNGRAEGGAVSVDGTNEYTFNVEIARFVQSYLADLGIRSIVIEHYEGGTYGVAMSWLAKQLKDLDATIAIELHFNAANGSARGHEWLYWNDSTRGEKLAKCLKRSFDVNFTPSRGIKPRKRTDRGAEFLRLTHCPAVIAEPFFGDNQQDWSFVQSNKTSFVKAYALGIRDYFLV